MKRKSFATTFVLAVLALIGLAGPLAAGEQVPFRGSLEGDFTATPLSPPILRVDITGTGNATQLGHFTFAISLEVNLTNNHGTGSAEFIAANGDTLTADVAAQGTPTTTPGVLAIVENTTITGGTGRFAGASGTFITERLLDNRTRTTIGSFEGSISTPGAGRP
jgi:hypothetical protein